MVPESLLMVMVLCTYSVVIQFSISIEVRSCALEDAGSVPLLQGASLDVASITFIWGERCRFVC